MKKDVILISCLILAALLLWMIPRLTDRKDGEKKGMVIISQDGQEIGRYALSENRKFLILYDEKGDMEKVIAASDEQSKQPEQSGQSKQPEEFEQSKQLGQSEQLKQPEQLEPSAGEFNRYKELAHYNVVEICDGKASVTEADCPDKLCVGQREISGNGESIICLPHKLVVRTQSEVEGALDGLTY